MVGIDISKWQGEINWDKVKASKCPKVDFVILRSNYGKYYDSTLERNATECERVGVPYGLYVFSTAQTIGQVMDEATSVIMFAKQHKVSWPIYFDFEDEAMAKLMQIHGRDYIRIFNEMIITFCDYIEDAGYFAGVYFNQNFRLNYVNDYIKDRYAIWYAYYRKKLDFKKPNLIWQYANNGVVAGIIGDVDMNMTDYDIGKTIKIHKLNHWREI